MYPYSYPYSNSSGSETSLISDNDNEDEDVETDHEEGVVAHGYDLSVGLAGGVRAPRMRRTYSGLGPTGTGSEEETLFFGRYFTSSPVPLEEGNQNEGEANGDEEEVVREGNEDEGVLREEQERSGETEEAPATVRQVDSSEESSHSQQQPRQPGLEEPTAEDEERQNEGEEEQEEEQEEENVHGVGSNPESSVQPTGSNIRASSPDKIDDP